MAKDIDEKTLLYSALQKKIVFLTLLVSLAPLLVLGISIYHQFREMYKDKIREQIRYRSRAQAEAVDLFLKERTAILSAMAESHTFQEMTDEENLSHIFKVMNTTAGAFVDLGVISNSGQHFAYIGPYDLEGLNYYQQPWFAEVMSKGVYISDVYMGFRELPHFIIAVRRQEGRNVWILRATIDLEVLGNIVKAAQLGRTGDAFIVNRSGTFQTQPRQEGELLCDSRVIPSMFGGGTSVIQREIDGRTRFCAGSWLNHGKWLLVITQHAGEEMSGLFATWYTGILIIVVGMIAIIATTLILSRQTVERLRETEERIDELNAQLVQSDKMAALGKMAAGVAHEINNPLSVILQKTGWLEDLIEDEPFQDSKTIDEYKTSIQKIEEHVERARKVVHNMLGYARRMEPHLEDTDINQTINETISLLNNYARINNIEIQPDLAPDLPIISSEPDKLQQVFLNLMTNAIDAIGNNGLIQVKSRHRDDFLAVEVTDNGAGIPEDKQKKVFDPFFTTKSAGKGVGLGLWVSYDIVEKMGGTISLRSQVGQGTTFTVKIPVVVPEKK